VAEGKLSAAPGGKVVFSVKAKIADGYHLYSLTTPKGGPIATKLRFTPESGVATFTVEQPNPELRMDATFGIPVESFAGEAEFVITAQLDKNLDAGMRTVTAVVRYQACSNVICLPPAERMAKLEINIERKR